MSLLRWFAPAPPTRVLLFHRVTELEADPCRLAIAPARFHSQLETLAARYDFVPSDPALRPRRGRRPRLALTFDDGFADNVSHALPILERLGIPATFFIASDAVGSDREFWWTELERLLLAPTRLPAVLAIDGPIPITADLRHDPGTAWGGHPEWTLDRPPPGPRHALFAWLADRLHRAAVPDREGCLEALRFHLEAGPTGRQTHLPVNREGLLRLASNSCACLGAHTRTHPRLAGLNRNRQRDEIAGSKSALEALVGRRIDAFAYPYGSVHDYDPTSCEVTRESGFTHAFGNHGSLAGAENDSFRLPRLCVLDWDPPELLARIDGFA